MADRRLFDDSAFMTPGRPGAAMVHDDIPMVREITSTEKSPPSAATSRSAGPTSDTLTPAAFRSAPIDESDDDGDEVSPFRPLNSHQSSKPPSPAQDGGVSPATTIDTHSPAPNHHSAAETVKVTNSALRSALMREINPFRRLRWNEENGEAEITNEMPPSDGVEEDELPIPGRLLPVYNGALARQFEQWTISASELPEAATVGSSTKRAPVLRMTRGFRSFHIDDVQRVLKYGLKPDKSALAPSGSALPLVSKYRDWQAAFPYASQHSPPSLQRGSGEAEPPRPFSAGSPRSHVGLFLNARRALEVYPPPSVLVIFEVAYVNVSRLTAEESFSSLDEGVDACTCPREEDLLVRDPAQLLPKYAVWLAADS
jgi:hypothetical protein